MKILVPIKRVADSDNANKVKVSADGTQVTTEGLEWKMNPFDEWALEAALRLTEDGAAKSRVGEVVLVSVGPKEAVATVREGLAKGAERGVIVEGNDNDLDSNVIAAALAAVAKKESPDLIVMGKQTVDGDSNVAGTVLADKLGWPIINYAMRIETSDDGKTFAIKRDLDVGVASVKVTGPVVITVSDSILHPESVKNGVTPADFKYPEAEGGRYASLKGIMQAKKKPIAEQTLSGLGVDAKRTVTYKKFELPPARSGQTTFVESVEELVEKLRTEAKVL